MPRPRTPINAYGRLTVQQVEPGRWRARARYRFENGTLKQVERFGPTKAAAEWALKSALTTLTASAAVEVRRETRLADLADRFLHSKADRAPRTIDTYRQTVEHLIKPNIGSLAVSEATTERLAAVHHPICRPRTGRGPRRRPGPCCPGCSGSLRGPTPSAANPVRDLSPDLATIDRRRRWRSHSTGCPVLLKRVREDAQLQARRHGRRHRVPRRDRLPCR